MIKGYVPTGRVRYISGDKIEELENGKWRLVGPTPQHIGTFDEVIAWWVEHYPQEAQKIALRAVNPSMKGVVEEQQWVRRALDQG